MKRIAALALVFAGAGVTCLAVPACAVGCSTVPEIDLGSIGAASALACMIYLMTRRRAKDPRRGKLLQ